MNNSSNKKKRLTYVLTDSGLGGMSIAADLARRIEKENNVPPVRIVFYNCLPGRGKGFDSMPTLEEKTRVFLDVLRRINASFDPDAILVACNTLSVLFDDETFEETPVHGIVKAGVDMISSYLDSKPDATVLMFGVKTIVMSGIHRKLLIERGYAAEQLIYQACDGLAQRIENGPDSKDTREKLDGFISKAVNALPGNHGPVAVSLNCTHYGYIHSLFPELFKKHGVELDAVLDPNRRMIDDFMHTIETTPGQTADLKFEVLSNVPMTDDEKTALVPLLEPISEKAAEALQNASAL